METHPPDFCCEKCKYSTNIKYLYKQHCASKKHSGETRKPRSDKQNEVYNCDKCNYTSLNKNNYTTHVLNNHSTSQERKAGFSHYCEPCDFGVFMQSAFDTHLATKRHLMKTSNKTEE